MKVAIIGTGINIAWIDELCDIVSIIKEAECWNVPNCFITSEEIIEATPYVASYQSRESRPVIWAAALRQFYRR